MSKKKNKNADNALGNVVNDSMIFAGDPALFQSLVLWKGSSQPFGSESPDDILTGDLHLTVGGYNIWSVSNTTILPVVNYLLNNWDKMYSITSAEEYKRYLESDSSGEFSPDEKRISLHLAYGNRFDKRNQRGIGDVYITLIEDNLFRIVTKRPSRLASWTSSAGLESERNSFDSLTRIAKDNTKKYTEKSLDQSKIESNVVYVPAKVLLPALSSILKSCYFRLKKYGVSKYNKFAVPNQDIVNLLTQINSKVFIEELNV